MTKKIRLTQGKVALVDDDDYGRVSQYLWHAVFICGHWYAARMLNGKVVYLHRFLSDTTPENTIDHSNGDGLDCRKKNMVPKTWQENLKNNKRTRIIASAVKLLEANKKNQRQEYSWISGRAACKLIGRSQSAVKSYFHCIPIRRTGNKWSQIDVDIISPLFQVFHKEVRQKTRARATPRKRLYGF